MRKARSLGLPGTGAPRGALLLGAVLVCILGLAGCSLGDYENKSSTQTELPTAVFNDYSHTVVEKGKTRLVLKAGKAESYEASKKMVLSGVTFTEYDISTGEVDSQGKADKVVYFTDSKDADFSGSVYLESKSQDVILRGEHLHWTDKAKKLESGLENAVTISRGDGSMVSGAGFEAEARTRTFAFQDSVEGFLTEKKDKP